jgi:hypothetical protein
MSDERRHLDAYYDEAGRFIHPCWCGREGAFGVGSFPSKGILGRYYCREHRPVQQFEPASSASPQALGGPPGLHALITKFGGYDRITADARAQFDRKTEQHHPNIRAGAPYEPAPTTAAEGARDLLVQPRTKAAR